TALPSARDRGKRRWRPARTGAGMRRKSAEPGARARANGRFPVFSAVRAGWSAGARLRRSTASAHSTRRSRPPLLRRRRRVPDRGRRRAWPRGRHVRPVWRAFARLRVVVPSVRAGARRRPVGRDGSGIGVSEVTVHFSGGVLCRGRRGVGALLVFTLI